MGFAAEEQILKARYYNERSKAQLAIDKAYQDYEEKLDPNDTDNWIPSLEELQKTYPDLVGKIKSNRLRSELPAMFEDASLRQRSSLFNYKKVVDARNFQQDYQTNYRSFMENASKQSIETPAAHNEAVASSLKSLFGLQVKDPERPIEMGNLETVEDYDNPLFHTEKLRMDQARVWLEGEKQARNDYVITQVSNYLLEHPDAGIDNPNAYMKARGIEGKFSPDDIEALQSAYRIRQRRIAVEQQAAIEAEQRKVSGEAYGFAQNNDFKGAMDTINNSQLDSDWKISQLKKMQDAIELMHESKDNPMKVRQDESAYLEMWRKVNLQPESVTVQDIQSGTGTKWTVNDEKEFFNDLEKAKTGGQPEYVKTMIDLMDEWYGNLKKANTDNEGLADIAARRTETLNKFHAIVKQWQAEGKTPTPQEVKQAIADILAEPEAAGFFSRWWSNVWKERKATTEGLENVMRKTMLAPNLALGRKKTGSVSPYEEYPDAFLENGVWKVIRNGKTYRIED